MNLMTYKLSNFTFEEKIRSYKNKIKNLRAKTKRF